MIAFLTAWADNTVRRGRRAAWVHYGMTSSDLIDTALAVQLTEATDILIGKATRLIEVLRDHALAHRDTLRPGGTHGDARRARLAGDTGSPTSPSPMARSRDRLVRGRGRRSRSAPCPARWATTPTSTRPSRPRCCRRSGCGPPRWPPRS